MSNFLIVFGLCSYVAAWSHSIHRVVAQDASELLSKEARARIAYHLGEGSIVDWAAWADEHQSYPKYWHYVRLSAVGQPCGPVPHDLYCALEHLMDARYPIAEQDRIRLLVHLVVDAHQPLHVDSSFANISCRVRAPRRLGLHAWTDKYAVGMRNPQRLRTTLKKIRQKETIDYGTPASWLRENAQLWPVIYPSYYGEVPYYCEKHPETVPIITEADKKKIAAVMRLRLAQASVRLAYVLNTLYG